MPMPSMPPPAQARLASGNEFLAPISITNHWEATHKITQKYDKGFMENWKDELEKCLIIVSALFLGPFFSCVNCGCVF